MKKFKTKYKNHWGLSEAGYYHIPVMYAAFGSNGFTFCLLGQSITISWHTDERSTD